MCRTKRSKSPLSIAFFHFDSSKDRGTATLKEFLKLIQDNTRETDIFGYFGKDVIVVILPDTDEKMTQEFKERILNGHKNPSFSIVTRTYPDPLFHELLSGSQILSSTNLIEKNYDEINQRGIEKSSYIARFSQDDLLTRSCFLKQLRREERRANRFKSPLSIALFHFDSTKDSEFSNFKGIFKFIRNVTRETDVFGYLGEGVIGVLLPDTDEKGAQDFKERIHNRYKNLPFSIITGTYPDRLFCDILTENQEQSDFYPLFFDDARESKRFEYFLKRCLDIVGAFVGILLLSPLMLITALAVKVNSPGPAIFKQIRLGKKGAPFVLYKFRSMRCNVDDKIHREYITHLIQGNHEEINQGDKEKPVYKMTSDSRITRVGKFIRKTSIDELPQLFNVLKGEMSLVGPRPPLSYEVEQYQSWHLRRILEMKPGITGLWQVYGRSATTFDDMVRSDIRYIRNWSLMLDIKILIKTVKSVLSSPVPIK